MQPKPPQTPTCHYKSDPGGQMEIILLKYFIARGHVISSQWKENLEEIRDKDISCSAGGVDILLPDEIK